MKEVYGTEEYNMYNQVDWEKEAVENCLYVTTPKQGANECGFYALKLATIFNGLQFVQKITNTDVCTDVSLPTSLFFSG